MPEDTYEFEFDSDETGLVEATIYYCYTPAKGEIRDPERPEPAEPALVEVEKIEPESVARVLTFEQAEEIVKDVLDEAAGPCFDEREIDDDDF